MDVLTPKQVMFFHNAIKILEGSGNQVLCTSRHYREAVELAKLKALDLKIIGAHGGAERFEKLRASANRVRELAEIIHQFKPDVAIAFSSPEAARVAYGLGIPHIGFNDSPHAEAVGRLTVPLMNLLYTPWIIPYRLWTEFGLPRSRIEHYHALDPAAWLKTSQNETNNFAEEKDRKRKILVRMEEEKAAYIADKRLRVDISLIDSLVGKFSESAEINILCRYEDQIERISAKYDGKARVIQQVIDGTELIRSVDIFIGGGGTMTTEAALLGKPTISIAPFTFLVEDYLERVGLAWRAGSPASLLKLVRKMLDDNAFEKRQKRVADRLLARMEDPTEKIVQAATTKWAKPDKF